MSWEEVTLGEVSYTLKGFAFKSVWFTNSKSGIPVVKVKDFTSDSISIEEVEYLPINIANDYQKYQLKSDDVIIQTVGSWASNPNSVVGKVVKVPAILENGLLNQNAVKLIFNDKVDNTFVFYNLKTNDFKGYIINTAQGAASQASISLESIKSYKFDLPPLETQKRIAFILSTYDDLIENNLKRIKLLEETAQNIYKEWFVNFRFPNYEHTEFDAESGLPVGWELKKMVELMNISGGGTPSTKIPNYWDGEVLWFSPTDLGKNSSLILLDSSKKITPEGLTKSSAKLLPPMTILMSSRATIGLFGMINKECSTNQGFINIIPKDIFYRYYILHNLIYRKNEIIGKASGTTFKEISKGVFNNMEIIEPKSNIIIDFFNICEPIFKQVENIENQNQKLKEARDILLPRLMNRTIEV